MKNTFIIWCFCLIGWCTTSNAQVYWGNLFLENQWEIDALPYYDSIAGHLVLGKLPPAISDIQDLSKFKHLKALGGDFVITSTLLTDLRGLDSLADAGLNFVEITDNQYLKNLDGLGSIDFGTDWCCEFYITNNPQLERLTTFTNLDSLLMPLQIWNNPKLATLKGLENIKNGRISITSGVFKSLDGLQGGIGVSLGVTKNDSLVSIRDFLPTQSADYHTGVTIFRHASGLSMSASSSFTTPDYLPTDTMANTSISINYCDNLKSLQFSQPMSNMRFAANGNANLETIRIENVDTIAALYFWDNAQLQRIDLPQDNKALGKIDIEANPRLKTLTLPGGDPIYEPSDTLQIDISKSDGKQLSGWINIAQNDSLQAVYLPDYNSVTRSSIMLSNNKQLETFYTPYMCPTYFIKISNNNLKKLEFPSIHGNLEKNIEIIQMPVDSTSLARNDLDTIIGIGNYESLGAGINMNAPARFVSNFKQRSIATTGSGFNSYHGFKVDTIVFENFQSYEGKKWIVGGFIDMPYLKVAPLFLNADSPNRLTIRLQDMSQLKSLDALSIVQPDTINLSIYLDSLTDCDVVCKWRDEGVIINYTTPWNWSAPAPCDSLERVFKSCLVRTDEPVEQAVEVYPNPASTMLTVKHSSVLGLLMLINTQGTIIKRVEPMQEIATLHLSGLSKGVYFLLGKDINGGTFQRKVVVLGD